MRSRITKKNYILYIVYNPKTFDYSVVASTEHLAIPSKVKDIKYVKVTKIIE